jgi:hypothetical protein
MTRITIDALFVSALLLTSALSAATPPAQKALSSAMTKRIEQFFADKESQAKALAKRENQEQAPEVWKFFAAGKKGDWENAVILYQGLRSGAYQYSGGRKDKRLETMVWQPINEAFGAYEESANGDERYVTMFARDILDIIPPGSIYFGGTDPGRWLVTLFAKSHEKADPCFVLTQNALADGLYLKYLREMYGKRIAMPSDDDAGKAFADYTADAQRRLHENALKSGENVHESGDGKVQVSGQVAVMEINARIARKIFDANPDRENYIEESFALGWMFPYLSPRGPIMKINRKPLAEMPEDDIKKDRAYWAGFIAKALGPDAAGEGPWESVCDFAKTIYKEKELDDFKGDARYLRNNNACRTFSKLRSSIAGVYAWRSKNAESPAERRRMAVEADLAFRQAFALCPYSSEAVLRGVAFLTEQDRKKEALELLKAAEAIDRRNANYGGIIWDLEQDLDPKK